MQIIKERQQLKSNSQLGMRKQKVVSIPGTTISDENVQANAELLQECRRYWDSLQDFRERRLRSRKYYRGDQWSDRIENPDKKGEYISEETYIKNQGKVPLKQNQIRQLVKNLLGQFISNPSKVVILSRTREDANLTDMVTNALHAALDVNEADDLDIALVEECTISGTIPQKVSYKYWPERNIEDLYLQNINPTRMFFNTDVADIRLHDLRLIGEIIDTTLNNIIGAFAKSPADEKRIRELYTGISSREALNYRGLDASITDNMDFFIPYEPNSARMYEIWKLESSWKVYAHDPLDATYSISPYTMDEIAAQNDERIRLGLAQGMLKKEIPLIEAEPKYEQAWHYKFLTPDGHVLREGETPYKHEEHPYAFVMAPMLDGEVWGFVEDIIDQQRYINRLIIMMDFIMSASAKGVLMIPEDLIPDGMTVDDFSKEWVKFNGVIVYKPSRDNPQAMPKQISANSTSVGISEMISLQMSLIQEISGVHGAIQGQQAKSGTPSSLYAQESQNASLNNLSFMKKVQQFERKRNRKALKVILQYYKDKRYLAINGRSTNIDARLYDPDLVRDIDFDIVVTQGKDTPVYRAMIDDTLMQLLQGQLIDLEMFLEQTSMPFADKLLAAVKQRKQQMMESGQVPPEVAQAAGPIQEQANPQAMQMAQKFLGKQAPAA